MYTFPTDIYIVRGNGPLQVISKSYWSQVMNLTITYLLVHLFILLLLFFLFFFVRGTVSKQGSHWELKKVAAHFIFPPDAVSEDRLMALYRWKITACSPPLQENEAIVSDVVELSAGIYERLAFNREVTLAISHSASDLKGYEVVLKKLIDKETNEWVDVDKTIDFRSLSGIKFLYDTFSFLFN